MIAIQTSFQRDFLKHLIVHQCVCINSTNRTNMYDFFITILALGELGEEFKAAVMRKESTQTSRYFYTIFALCCLHES